MNRRRPAHTCIDRPHLPCDACERRKGSDQPRYKVALKPSITLGEKPKATKTKTYDDFLLAMIQIQKSSSTSSKKRTGVKTKTYTDKRAKSWIDCSNDELLQAMSRLVAFAKAKMLSDSELAEFWEIREEFSRRMQ